MKRSERKGFINGKPFVVTGDYLTEFGTFCIGSKRFRCGLCGYKFKEDDIARWQYLNDQSLYGNIFVCEKCDTGEEGVIAAATALYEEYKNIRKRLWMLFEERE